MSFSKLKSMLQSDDKMVSKTFGVTGVLARLWRIILMDLEINVNTWMQLMVEYVRDRDNRVPNNKRDQSSVQGNLIKELTKSSMSWKIFCKGLRFIRVTKFELSLTLHFRNKRVSNHVVTVNLYEGDLNTNLQEDSDN